MYLSYFNGFTCLSATKPRKRYTLYFIIKVLMAFNILFLQTNSFLDYNGKKIIKFFKQSYESWSKHNAMVNTPQKFGVFIILITVENIKQPRCRGACYCARAWSKSKSSFLFRGINQKIGLGIKKRKGLPKLKA